MKGIGVMLIAPLMLCGTSGLASEPEFQYSRTITAPALSQVELLAVPLDSAVYEATENGLPDMRLFDGQGQGAPYLLRKAQTTRTATVRKTWTSRRPTARPLDDGGLEITVELDEDDPRPNGLTLVSPLKDFEHRVRVLSFADGEQWKPLGEEAVIFDYSRYIDVRRDQVPFPETRDRHFRIVIDNITSAQESELLELTRQLRGAEETGREEQVTIARRPFRIERINFWREDQREQSTGDKKTEYPVSDFRVEQDPEKKQTLIFLEAMREPLTSLELQTPARNFSRRAAVEVEEKRGVQTSWRTIGANTLSRIDFKGLKQEQLAIEFSESRRDAYRVAIDNRDSSPLEVTGIKAKGNEYEIVFLASPDTQYRLAYGSTDAAPPQYDTAAISQVLGEGFRPTLAELGPLTPAQGQAAAFRWSDILNNRPLLFGAIVLLVIVLGWGLYHAMKRVDNLPGE